MRMLRMFLHAIPDLLFRLYRGGADGCRGVITR